MLDGRTTRHLDACCVAGRGQEEAPRKATGRPVRRTLQELAQGVAGLGGEAGMQG